LKRSRASRIKSKAVVDDDSDLDIIVGPDAGQDPKDPKVTTAPAPDTPAPMAVDGEVTTPLSSKTSPATSSSSSEVCWLPYALVPELDVTSPSYLKVKALASTSSGRNPHKRARLEDSLATQVTRAAYQELELEVKSLSLRIQALTRTHDTLKSLMDAF
ncbi:hypothetical protein CVT24_010487, partial [Panaeolus cyanescens]